MLGLQAYRGLEAELLARKPSAATERTKTVEFIDGERLRSGEVWSPGPVARSVWVLVDQPDGTREPVAVKLATGKRQARRIDWSWRRGQVDTTYVDLHLRAEVAQVQYRARHVDAPPLSTKDWREALGEQSALTSAA